MVLVIIDHDSKNIECVLTVVEEREEVLQSSVEFYRG